MSALRDSAWALIAAGLCGCSFAPAYKVPATPPPANAYQETGEWLTARPAEEQSRGAWWNVFHEPQLDALELAADDANQDLKAALARLLQARAETRIVRADYFPTVSAEAAATRSRTSINSPGFPSGNRPVGNNFELEADLTYEFDLWGRIRNSVAAAKATEQGSKGDLAALALSIHAEVAEDYFTLRAEDAQQDLLDRTVSDYTQSLKLTRNLYEGGAAALADVDQAEAQLETARTQAADIRLQRAQSAHALAVILGKNPSTFQASANPLPADAPPPAVDAGLPSMLLERRPDVAAAERRVAAANAAIGVARAAYFPVFSLSAATGVDSTNVATWLNAPSRLWSVGPTGVLTLFDAGRHAAATARARAAYDEQVADYRKTVLTAFQEVEDALAALRQLQQESVTAAAAVTATGKALQQAQYRYKAGLVTYLEVATSENTALQAQLTGVNVQLRRLNASVLLVKALGGGWQRQDLQSAQVLRGEVPVRELVEQRIDVVDPLVLVVEVIRVLPNIDGE